MNQSNWKKFCEDADLIDEKFTANEVALVFAASKEKGSNDISYKEFRTGLGRVAKKKEASSEDVAASVSGAAPKTDGTTQANVSESLEGKTGNVKDHSGEEVLPVPASKDLKVVFTSFAFFGKGDHQDRMGVSNWTKFCEDADLIDEKFAANEVPVVFAASKEKGKNDIDYKEFRYALGRIAVKKYGDKQPEEAVTELAEFVKDATPQTKGTTTASVSESLEQKTGNIQDHSGEEVVPVSASKAISAVFTAFASFGKGEDQERMGVSNWTKFCEDSGLIDDEKFTANDVAVVFAASKEKGLNDINEDQFRNALGRIAKKKYSDKDPEEAAAEIADLVKDATPQTKGTTTASVSESLEEKTGVYARGGGSNKDADKDLNALTNRGVKTDARGVPISKEHM